MVNILIQGMDTLLVLKKGSWGIILELKRALGHKGGKRALWGIILMVKRALGHNFGAKKALGAIFDESPYAVTWGSLRMRSRPPPLPLCRIIPLMDILMEKRALVHNFDGKKGSLMHI